MFEHLSSDPDIMRELTHQRNELAQVRSARDTLSKMMREADAQEKQINEKIDALHHMLTN